MYDIIGDSHGHADKLETLLRHLGYRSMEGVYRHSGRTVIFLGDFIDRGPKIRETLAIVRPMVESGSAQAVMGNHELNFLAHVTAHPRKPGEHLRSAAKRNQIRRTEEQLGVDIPLWTDWFRTLPLWLELDGLRAVHACWDPKSIAALSDRCDLRKTDHFLAEACLPEGERYDAVETLLKGKEAELPRGIEFTEKHGEKRRQIRLKWYASPARHTYTTYSLGPETVNCDADLDEEIVQTATPYPADEKPVFFGHYGLLVNHGALPSRPSPLASNVACVDWGVANEGLLCAYRWNGEQRLDAANFICV